ncbi:hypothetical protein [Donghicola sp.]|jgi:hypothetical protein|uniref:hypothetical protein n=1 Tax=Donghicola sp. TaxID=1929294 RepID=UPI0025EEB587|nr:hypothetical protein [Donghicola sp.]MCT4576179.1 hypothetical protein [Donghicola sp.]
MNMMTSLDLAPHLSAAPQKVSMDEVSQKTLDLARNAEKSKRRAITLVDVVFSFFEKEPSR